MSSWLNNSFVNQIKGQLEQLAHDVLTENENPPGQLEETLEQQVQELNQLEILESSQKKIDDLLNVCHQKDTEISSLQKLINELQTAVQTKNSNKNADFEDSWCWEPDNQPSTNKKGKKSNRVNNQMTTVSLEDEDDEQNEQKLRLENENVDLKEQLTKLRNANAELNRNLDELDSQHNLAIENVIETKNQIQEKLQKLTKDFEIQSKENIELSRKFDETDKNYLTMKDKFEKLQNAYTVYVEENVSLKEKLENVLEDSKQNSDENSKLKQCLKDKDKQLLELIEKVENDFGAEREEENQTLKKKLQDLTEQLDQSKKLESKLIESVSDTRSGSSSSGKHSEDEFIVVEDELQRSNSDDKYNEDKTLYEEKIKENVEKLTEQRAEIKSLKIFSNNLQEDLKCKISELLVSIDEVNKLKTENDLLRNDLDSANSEFTDYQEEQENIRKELDAKILNLEDKILDLQDKNSYLEQKIQNQILQIDEISKLKSNDENDLAKLKENYESKLNDAELKYTEYVEDMRAIKENLESRIADLGNEVKILTNRRSPELEQEGIPEMERLKSENDLYKCRVEELKDKLSKCEENASDVESKLVMESVELQKKIIDLESKFNTEKSVATDIDLSNDTINFIELKKLFTIYAQIDLTNDDTDTIETAFKSIKDRIWKIDILEKNLKQMSDEITKSSQERQSLQHEISTLNADIENYKIECNELMKNNEILLNELENLQRNKLQPIPENNEENLIILEKQLEDCNNLNKSLEDGYKELNKKIEELEEDKEEALTKIQSFEDINAMFTARVEELTIHLQNLETEKCNLIFEINEMKTDDKKSAVDADLLEHKSKIKQLEEQLNRLNKDHSDLIQSMQSQKTSLLDSKRECDRLEKLCREKDINLHHKEQEISKYEQEFETLQLKLIADSSTEDDKENLVKLVEQLKLDKITVESKLNEMLNINEENLKKITDLINNNDELKMQITEKTLDNNEISVQTDDATNELKTTVENLIYEKNEMIKTIQTKHNENLQYYNEIQRLGKLLQSVEFDKNTLIEDLNKKKINCENCSTIKNDFDENLQEMEKLKDQIHFLKEKSDILQTNLLTEQTNQKLIHQENSDLVEKCNNLNKDLDRLRQHLVELEDAHTQEMIEMQDLVDQTNSKMFDIEEKVSKSNTAYTSASIRANQHAETLQAQYSLVTQQRDELVAKLSLAEDRELKNQAALINLQCALEQFQRDKNRDVELGNSRIRRELANEKDIQKLLQNDINVLRDQLNDANQGLLAASRLSDQLELSKDTNSKLKIEIENIQEKLHKLKTKLESSESSQADKIEKSLIKSLLIGYIVSNTQNDKNQVLKVITTVLDFNQNENDKIGLNKHQTGWFSGLMNTGGHNKENLVEAFVHFLEKESQPRNDPATMPNLLNIIPETSGERKMSNASSIGSSSNNQNSGTIQPILLGENILEQLPANRNSSSILKDILNS